MNENETHLEALINTYGLQPLIPEGGYFNKIYPLVDSNEVISRASAIYYLMSGSSFSSMHRLTGDEIWHYYSGDPVEQIQIYPDGTLKRIILGADPERGDLRMAVVPAGVWQGTKILNVKAGFALCGCTVIPEYTDESYTHGVFSDLVNLYPQHEETIARFCYTDEKG